MNTINKEIKNRDGSIETLMISSNDSSKVNLSNKYVLVGYAGNKYIDNFKNSILGMDISNNNKGFARVAIISTLLAIAMILVMYLSFKI